MEKKEKKKKKEEGKKRRQKFLRPFFINSGDGDGDGWSRRRQQTQGYVARVVMATQLTRHFTCRIRVLAAIFALIALYFAFREPSLKRARDQPDEQPYPLPLYTQTHTPSTGMAGGWFKEGWGGCYPCAAASFGFTEFTLLGSVSFLERAVGTMCPGTVLGSPRQS